MTTYKEIEIHTKGNINDVIETTLKPRLNLLIMIGMVRPWHVQSDMEVIAYNLLTRRMINASGNRRRLR